MSILLGNRPVSRSVVLQKRLKCLQLRIQNVEAPVIDLILLKMCVRVHKIISLSFICWLLSSCLCAQQDLYSCLVLPRHSWRWDI